MNLAITLSITLAVVPNLVVRYISLTMLITKKERKLLQTAYVTIFLVQTTLLYLVINCFLLEVTPLFYKLVIMMFGLLYFCLNCIIIKGMFFQHLFIIGMQGNYALILHSLVAIILSLIYQDAEGNQRFLLQTIIYLLVFVATAYPFWRLIKNSLILKFSRDQDYHWHIIWLMPTLLFLSNSVATMNNSWINTWRQLFVRILAGAAVILSWKCVNLDFKELEKNHTLESANQLLQMQMNAITNQAETILEHEKKVHIMRHDLRHHIQMLSSLMKTGELIAATTLIHQLEVELESTKPVLYCKNPLINAALLVYMSKAQKEQIEINLKTDIPEVIPWNSSDLAILFANTIENAIHASIKQPLGQRVIKITTRYDSQKLAIKIENRFDGAILFHKNGLPRTMERDHGIGMESISSIIEQYHGHMVCSYENGWFSILFLFSQHHNSL